MHYVTEAASFLWSKSLLRKDGEMERQQPLPLSSTKLLWGVAGAHKLPGYQKHGCVTVQLASCCKYCHNLGCQFDTPRKREPQWRNCFHQIGSRAHLWCVFLVANWCRRNQDTVGILRQAGLGCRRKVAWNLGTNQKAALLHGLCFHSCLKFLPWLPSAGLTWKFKRKYCFLLKLLSVVVFIAATKSKQEHMNYFINFFFKKECSGVPV